jgi:hypothetical protein
MKKRLTRWLKKQRIKLEWMNGSVYWHGIDVRAAINMIWKNG